MSVRKGSESLQSSCMKKLCVKHPQRQATHFFVGNGVPPETFYCEKCSIMLASQGFNVVKIGYLNCSIPRKLPILNKPQRMPNKFSGISNRKNQISNFVLSLQSLYNQLDNMVNGIQEYLIKSQTQHGRLIQQASAFYKAMEEIIELQKFTTYNSILSKRSIDESEVRQKRNIINEAMEEVQSMITDIRDNMQAVESVEYSIYTTIMGGYQNKIEKAKQVTKEVITMKPIQKCTMVLPQIPKSLYTLSDKISIAFATKSNTGTINNSIMGIIKPQIVVSQEDACMLEQSSSSQQSVEQEQCQLQQNNEVDDTSRSQNQILPPINSKQISAIKTHGNFQQLAFSFDSNGNNSKEVKLDTDENCLETFKHLIIRGFEDGKLSKIEERMNSKEVYESRESLGQYLNTSNSRNDPYIEDTQTLLIV